jgi:hypothetical protein
MDAIHNNKIPPEAELLLLQACIGQLVIGWGNAEASLSMMIAVIYHQIGGRSKVGDKLPFVLKDKLAFVRKSLVLIKVLKPYRKRLGPILDGIAMHNRIRVGIIHGYLSGYDPTTGTVCFVKLDGGGTIHQKSHLTGTIKQIAEASRDFAKISWTLTNEMSALANTFMGQDSPHDASREVP